jgi:hypothetical protein
MLNFAGAVANSEDIVCNMFINIYTANRVWCIDNETVAFRADPPVRIKFKIQSGCGVHLGATGNQ